MFARVRCRGEEELTTPRGGRLVGGYWDYRWRKSAEWTTMDEHSQLWQPAAAWFARRPRSGSRARQRDARSPLAGTAPPGPGRAGASGEYAFYTYDVPAAGRPNPRDAGGRDLGAVLVQRGRDVHPRALQDRLRGRGLAWTISLAPALYSFFGDGGILPGHPDADAGAWGLLQLDSGPAAVTALYLLLLVGALCPLFGFKTRLAAVVVFVCLVSFARRDPWVLNSGDLLVIVLAFYLMLAPSGSSLSVDRWLGARARFWSSRSVRSGRFG